MQFSEILTNSYVGALAPPPTEMVFLCLYLSGRCLTFFFEKTTRIYKYLGQTTLILKPWFNSMHCQISSCDIYMSHTENDVLELIRMHSSKMHTTHLSGHLGWGMQMTFGGRCRLPLRGGGVGRCMLGYTPSPYGQNDRHV